MLQPIDIQILEHEEGRVIINMMIQGFSGIGQVLEIAPGQKKMELVAASVSDMLTHDYKTIVTEPHGH